MQTLELPLVGLLPLLVLLAGVEAWLGRRLGRGNFDWRESAASLAIALGKERWGSSRQGSLGVRFSGSGTIACSRSRSITLGRPRCSLSRVSSATTGSTA